MGKSSGVPGVTWHKPTSLWLSKIRSSGKTIQLGYRKDFFEAVCLVKSARSKIAAKERVFANNANTMKRQALISTYERTGSAAMTASEIGITKEAVYQMLKRAGIKKPLRPNRGETS